MNDPPRQVDSECHCAICTRGREVYDAWEKQQIADHGWYYHSVIDDPSCPHRVNVHTHGLQEKVQHPNLQICFPLKQSIYGDLLHRAVKLLEEGEAFEPGDRIGGIVNGYDVTFMLAMNDPKPVLRMILPDPANTLDLAQSAPVFAQQWDLDPPRV